jgi:radical SAM superfamily enzyme YgiQ (UPF0313 family)
MKILLVTDKFSIGVLDLAAYYESFGHVVDCALTDRLPSQLGQYDKVGYSFFGANLTTYGTGFGDVIDTLERLRQRFRGAEILLGGHGLELVKPAVLKTLGEYCDRIIRGDGERLVSATIDYENYPTWDPRHIARLSFTEGGRSVIAVQSARGCPYSCGFCCKSPGVRYFSPERTAENIRLVDDIRQLPSIVDDIFTLKADRMRALRAALTQKGVAYQDKIRFFTHAKHRNEDEIAAFSPSELMLGVESGDDRMLSLMNKGVTVQENREAVLRLHEAVPGRLVGLFLIGYPGENKESLQNTLEFVEETRHCYKRIWVSYFVPIPGTAGAELAWDKGVVLEQKLSNRAIAYVNSDELTAEVLRAYHDRLMAV